MIKVFLIERQKIVREGIKVLLEEENDLQIFTCESKDINISLLNRIKPDLVLVSLDNLDDADFSYLNIFLDLKQDRVDNCLFKVVVYAEKVNEFILNKVLNLGCQGYLLKESSIEELKQAIRSVARGYKHIGNSVFDRVKQLSTTSNEIAENIATNLDSYQTGLRTIDNLGSDELNYSNYSNSNLKLELSKPSVTQEKLDNVISQVNSIEDQLQLLGKPKKHWRGVGWIILSIALSSITGMALALAYSDRYRGLPTITKYGTINSNTIAIKTPRSGTIEQVNYQVGDLVKANDVLAEIEPASIQQQPEPNANSREIEQIKQQLESEKHLWEKDRVQLHQKQRELEELLVGNKIVKPNESIADSSPQLDNRNHKVAKAYKNYQNLQQLNEQNIVSQSELTRARQTWLDAKRELMEIQARQQSKDLHDQKQLEIEQLQGKIDNWQNKLKQRKQTVETLERDLTDLQNRSPKADSESLNSSEAISLKAPFKGIVKEIANPGNRVVAQETILNMVSCQNLWIEVPLNGEYLRQIDFQRSVAFHLENYRRHLTGRISAIESLTKFNQAKTNSPYYETAIANSYSAKNLVDNEMMFKVIVNFPLLENYMQQQEFCGVGDTGLITFNN